MNKQGTLYVIAAPSGCGKTSLVHALAKAEDDVEISVSFTTRPMRPGEENGVDYHFVDQKTFDDMIQNKEFLEYAKVFDHSYGTSRTWIAQKLDQGVDVILEIDWQGARQVGHLFHDVTSIFILPPSLPALRERLEARKQDSEKVIDGRMQRAISETSHYNEFEYLVVNDIFDQALLDLRSILHAQRHKRGFQEKKLADLLADLLKNH